MCRLQFARLLESDERRNKSRRRSSSVEEGTWWRQEGFRIAVCIGADRVTQSLRNVTNKLLLCKIQRSYIDQAMKRKSKEKVCVRGGGVEK